MERGPRIYVFHFSQLRSINRSSRPDNNGARKEQSKSINFGRLYHFVNSIQDGGQTHSIAFENSDRPYRIGFTSRHARVGTPIVIDTADTWMVVDSNDAPIPQNSPFSIARRIRALT